MALLGDLHRIGGSVLVVGLDAEDVGRGGKLLLAFGQGVVGGGKDIDGLIHRAGATDAHAVGVHRQGIDAGVAEGVRGVVYGRRAHQCVQRFVVVAARRLVTEGSDFLAALKTLGVEVLAFVRNLHFLGDVADHRLFVAVGRDAVAAVDHAGQNRIPVGKGRIHGKKGAGKSGKSLAARRFRRAGKDYVLCLLGLKLHRHFPNEGLGLAVLLVDVVRKVFVSVVAANVARGQKVALRNV